MTSELPSIGPYVGEMLVSEERRRREAPPLLSGLRDALPVVVVVAEGLSVAGFFKTSGAAKAAAKPASGR